VILGRVLAVLAAAFLVLAFALATLMPPPFTLAEALALIDPKLLYRLHESVIGSWLARAWTLMFMPLLLRPVWLLPASLGLLCMGGALTAGSNKSVPRSHRHRS
jgi:hypothetical protein